MPSFFRFCSARVAWLLAVGSSLFVGYQLSEWRRNSVSDVAQAAPAPAEPQLPRTGPTECRRADGPITIDGVADEPAWGKATRVTNFTAFWANRAGKTPTTARLLWDDKYLYFHCEMQDDDLFADVTEQDGNTWENDVFELFFRPDDRKPAYYEFEVSAANTHMDMFAPSRGSGLLRRWLKARQFGWETAVKLRGRLNSPDTSTDNAEGWSVEGRFPWSDFSPTGGRPKAGDVWRFALCRYDYSKSYYEPELTCSAPLSRADFHHIEDYTPLKFVGTAH